MAKKFKSIFQSSRVIVALQSASFLLALTVLIISLTTDDTFVWKMSLYLFCGLWAVIGIATVGFVMNFMKNAREKNELYDQVTLFVPGGFIDCKPDRELTILNCSDKLIRHLGYSETQFKEASRGSLLNIISPEDKNRVLDTFETHMGDASTQINFKLICKGNKTIPVIAICSFGKIAGASRTDAGTTVVKCLIIDSSSLKEIADERALDSERYKIVAEQSESIIFDFNVQDKIMFMNTNFEKKFGYKLPHTINIISLLKENDIIHPEDYPILIDSFRTMSEYSEIEARIKKADSEYIWCKIRMSTIFDENHRPKRVIGKIIDVDAQNKQTAQLIEKTKRDLMTGLYNKQTTELLVSEILRDKDDNSICALLVMDVDNFKQINDVLGHIVGDNVLSRISEDITMIFRSSDILGRVGGDEFVVFLKDLPSEMHAIKKASSILSIIREISLPREDMSLSASIGISFYAKDGKTYKELFEKADIAMYTSKRSNKNTFTVYDSSMKGN